MRITTRIAVGLFLMAGLLIVALAYQVSLVNRLQTINRELALTSLEATRISVRLLQGLDGVREFASKAAVLRDADYLETLEQWEKAVGAEVRSLSSVPLSPREDEIRARIDDGWRVYRRVAPSLPSDPTLLAGLEAVLDDIRTAVDELIVANEAAASAEQSAAVEKQERVVVVAWAAAASAIFLATLVSVLLFHSISGPLRRLARGTRELARGRFEHRLEVRGPRELSGLAGDFNHMAARLAELEDLKRDFVSQVSHELKTPLAAVHETVDVILDRLPGPLTAKQERLLELSRKSLNRLSAMIGELLEMSRLEAGAAHYDPRRCDLREIVRTVLVEMEPLAAERDLRVALEPSGDVGALLGDGERLRDVVVNLVGNAIKFSPREGLVTVRMSAADQLPATLPPHNAVARSERGPFLLLSVEDGGTGVPDEEKERIFEKFHQIGGRGRATGQGVGLGLAISRRIVEAHGGTVWVADRPGGGSVFSVLVPVRPARWRDLISDEPPVAEPARPRRTARPGPAKVPAGALVLVLALSALGGCASASAPPPPEPVATPPVRVEVASLPGIPVLTPAPPSLQSRLALARSLVASGYHEKAVHEFERILSLDPSREQRAEALWGMALVHLLADSPARDEERALALLSQLEEEFPDTLAGMQAGWARATLGDLAEVRREAEELSELTRRLRSDLQLLRKIDLDRRPSRSPSDSAPPPPPLR